MSRGAAPLQPELTLTTAEAAFQFSSWMLSSLLRLFGEVGGWVKDITPYVRLKYRALCASSSFPLRQACYCQNLVAQQTHLSKINRRGVFTLLYIIHLYSWIASVAFQVTTPSFKVADPQQARPDFGAEVVYQSVCDEHHLSTCLTLTNIKKNKWQVGPKRCFELSWSQEG